MKLANVESSMSRSADTERIAPPLSAYLWSYPALLPSKVEFLIFVFPLNTKTDPPALAILDSKVQFSIMST